MDIKDWPPVAIGYVLRPEIPLASCPDGWLPTDGEVYYGMDYPLLYGVLRRSHPHMTTGTHFTVPTIPGGWIKARAAAPLPCPPHRPVAAPFAGEECSVGHMDASGTKGCFRCVSCGRWIRPHEANKED